MDYALLAENIKQWAEELGFRRAGVADTDLRLAEIRLGEWLNQGRHGDMTYMAQHGIKRSRPAELLPGTLRVICLNMDYLPQAPEQMWAALADPARAYISRYALGRDYHKLLRQRLKQLAARILEAAPGASCRLFTDSAPVLEKPLAEKAGLGWIGKHTNLIDRQAGSWFFLGEIYTDLPLPVDAAPPLRQVREGGHCGTCRACLDICPTRAIVAPYQLDARRCISYLTIESHGPIPVALRPLLGNRVYGCDDCQLACPWNRFARLTGESDFLPRHNLDSARLADLFGWDEATFLRRSEGSPLRRLGYARWLRNLAVALGNGPADAAALAALRARENWPDEMVREHIGWALGRLSSKI
jgi:epoxyqueuosine reductase